MAELVNPDGTAWIPKFEGQRPPFQPGNTLALKHGATSAAVYQPIAQAHIDALMQDPGLDYLRAPRFARALQQWAVAQAKVDLLTQWVDSMTIRAAADSTRGSTSPLELLRKWMTTAAGYAHTLGLDPTSAARLGKDIAGAHQADAATLLTQARAKAEEEARAGKQNSTPAPKQ
jgi:hypothetical protein